LLTRSVVRPPAVNRPGSWQPLPAEWHIEVNRDIFYDCDQVRAMVKRFVDEGEWTIDEFRAALGSEDGLVTREQLNNFLGQSGPRNGIRCKAFPLCWEFFHRREKLSLPLAGASARRDEALL
jgi:hypothetical protein